jgi:hypothetical protein
MEGDDACASMSRRSILTDVPEAAPATRARGHAAGGVTARVVVALRCFAPNPSRCPAGNPLTPRIKSSPAPTYFTLCLPGSPKVNAGGACGAWLPGRELLRVSASTTASRGVQAFHLRPTPSPACPAVIVPRPARLSRAQHWTSFAQCMVPNASLDRCDR